MRAFYATPEFASFTARANALRAEWQKLLAELTAASPPEEGLFWAYGDHPDEPNGHLFLCAEKEPDAEYGEIPQHAVTLFTK